MRWAGVVPIAGTEQGSSKSAFGFGNGTIGEEKIGFLNRAPGKLLGERLASESGFSEDDEPGSFLVQAVDDGQ